MSKQAFSLLAALLVAMLAACGASPNTTESAAPDATTAPDTTTGALPELAATRGGAEQILTFEGAAGLPILAGFYAPDGAGPFPGVILLHMLGSDRTAWTEAGLVDALVEAGYAVLAVDMRGHGATGGEADWALAVEDLGLVWDAFAARDDVDETRTAVVGGSIGANMALRLAADRPTIRAAVLLSPGLDYRGVTSEDQMARYGARPVLLVASEDDPYSAESVAALDGTAAGESELALYQTAGHGTAMLRAELELTPRIVEWLGSHLAAE
jgi:dipeptidyl aminopeptidase/acylaminoacyl peptidase